MYDGNRNDYTHFPLVIQKFQKHLQELTGKDTHPSITLVFDKGNNSINNLKMLDDIGLNFVTSIRSSEAKELAQISNRSRKLKPCSDVVLQGTKAYRTKEKILGVERTIVVTYSQTLFDREWKTVHRNVDKALEKLKSYQQALNDRLNGVVTKGKKPTTEGIVARCKEILNKPYLKDVITTTVSTEAGLPRLEYFLDETALATYCKTSLGKTILTTTRDEWDTERIIKSYRSQYVVEDVFKEMKNREYGSWWPMFHWTDSKIRVHALYCSITLLLRNLMMRRVKLSGINIPSHKLLRELDDIKEVVNVTPQSGGRKKTRSHAVLTKLSGLQEKLASVLNLDLKHSSS